MKKIFFLIGFILLSLRFYPAIFEGRSLVFGDNYSLQVPERIYTGIWLRQGVIPWWNPTVFSGILWAQELSQTVFYPTTVLFTFLDPGIAINLAVASHLIFTMIGMFIFLKLWTRNDLFSFLGSVLWTFSTQVTGSSNNLVTIQAIAWFPWIAYFGLLVTRKKYGPLLFGVGVLGQFLAGYPQHVIYAIGLSLALSVVSLGRHINIKKWVILWTATGIITLCVTAVAWLPFVAPFTQSTRISQTSTQALTGSLNPLMMIKAIVPYFFDNPSLGIKWGPAWSGFPNSLFYITWFGVIGVLLGLRNANNQNKTLFLLIFLTLLISLGGNLPGFAVIQNVIPFFRFGRYPSMILVVTNFLLILVSINNLKKLSCSISKKTWVLILVSFLGISLLTILLLSTAFSSFWYQLDTLLHHKLSLSLFHTIERDYFIVRTIAIDVLATLSLFLAALFAFSYKRYALFLLIIGIDMIFNTQGMWFFAPSSAYPRWREIDSSQTMLPTHLTNPQSRTLTRNTNASYTDFGAYWESLTVRQPFSDSAVDAEELDTFSHLTQLQSTFSPDWNMVYGIPLVHGYTTLLPKDYAALWKTSAEPRINFIDHIALNNPLLTTWSVSNYLVDNEFPDISTPSGTVLEKNNRYTLYKMFALPRFRYEDNSPVDLTNYSEDPNVITIVLQNNRHTSMTIADRYDPNWQVTINGIKTPLRNVSGMRQFDLVPGSNAIRMQFFPQMFFWGLGITVFSFSLLLWLTSRWSSRNSHAQ